jgi:hypothetical protein
MARRFTSCFVLCAVFGLLLLPGAVRGQAASGSAASAQRILIDDFETYRPGELPVKWHAQLNGELVPLTRSFVNEREWFEVRAERGNHFVRAYARGEAAHVNMANGKDFDWNTRTHPILAWDWRAVELPRGAREDAERLNDSGAGIYVMFAVEGVLIKRPRVIKYVFSTSLPVGTVVSYGKLKVVVVASGTDGIGRWQHVERNVVEDHQRLFGEPPPVRPLVIRLWSDADNTDSEATADFDNVVLLPRS